MKRKIYVASSWRNEFQPEIVKKLRELGHEVYDFRNPVPRSGFAWSDINKNWQEWTTEEYKEALLHPIAEGGFNSDFNAMKWADTCIMVLPCGRSANTEAGWMKGAGKDAFVYQPIKQEPELMYKIYDGIITSIDELEKQFTTTSVEEISGHLCIGCDEPFNIDEMQEDSAGELYCKECWEVLSPIMKAEYEELKAKGEID